MQTFLPYPDLLKSVSCLDNKRLGKQRVEALQILKALTNPNYGWQHHPAVKMWRGFNTCLEIYMNLCIREWINRGFKNTMLMSAIVYESAFNFCWLGTEVKGSLIMPNWFGNKDFHNSHKSNLLRKDYDYYSRYNWNVPDNLSYVWPVK